MPHIPLYLYLLLFHTSQFMTIFKPTMASMLTLYSLLSLLLPSLISSSSSSCNKQDHAALMAVSKALGGVTSWHDNFGLCCDWDGIECVDGRVESVEVLGVTPAGAAISPAIGDLSFLQVIRIHKLSNLTGTIPPQISKLIKLRFLTISWTSVYGPVPAFLSKLQALEQLDLSFNQLSGTIPPSLGYLPNCSYINLSRNRLTGTIPSTLFHSPSAAQSGPWLLLSHNNLTGEIPKELADVNFVKFDVSRNHLTGDASFLFGKSKIIWVLDLSRNQFAFDFSNVEFPVDVSSVDVNHNMIYGSIPNQIINVTNTGFSFNVSYNRLCGVIPTGRNMAQLDASCYMHNKCLCGTPLPPCM